MRFKIVFIVLISAFMLAFLSPGKLNVSFGQERPNSQGAPPSPVLVELFTSEGCSDCPPADALLERLDQTQPVRGAHLIVLSEHVDYWNHDGWIDPFSSREYSDRQSAYAQRLGLPTVYTPQMVVDGYLQFVGSDERRATRAIEAASNDPKIPVTLSALHVHPNNTITLLVETGPLPASFSAESASVLIAAADDRDESRVRAGENSGRTLRHVAVLRDLLHAGAVTKSKKFSQNITLKLRGGAPEGMRIVAFVQQNPAGRILGAGVARAAQ